MAELLGFTIAECDESVPASTSRRRCKSESQRIQGYHRSRKERFTESTGGAVDGKVLKEKQSQRWNWGRCSRALPPSRVRRRESVIGGSSVVATSTAPNHCVGNDLLEQQDGNMAAGFYAVGQRLFPADAELRAKSTWCWAVRTP